MKYVPKITKDEYEKKAEQKPDFVSKEYQKIAERLASDMFDEEKTALFTQVKQGIDPYQAYHNIEERWNNVLPNMTDEEKELLREYKKDKISVASAIKNIKTRRRDEQWSEENPFKSFAKSVLIDVPVGALALGMEQVGNLADFVNPESGGKEFAQATKEATAETGFR